MAERGDRPRAADRGPRWRVLSPPGRAALALLGLRGPALADVLAALLGRAPAGGRASHVRVLDAAGRALDDALWLPLGPEEGVLSLHGNPVLVAAVTARLGELGVQEEPGGIERWGGGDRLAEEALRLLPAAPNPRGAIFLLAQRDRLAEWARAGVAASGAVPAAEIHAALARRAATLPFERPPRIALAGVPNAGKSTLFNRLLGRERVVVDERPGTTRDRIEEHGVVADRPVVWIDGAGLRESADEIEREGVRRMAESAAGADLVLLLVPPWGDVPELPARSGRPLLRIRSRADSIAAAEPAADTAAGGDAAPLAVSGRTGAGIPALLAEVARRLWGSAELPAAPTPFAERQVAALREVLRRREAGEDERPAWAALAGVEQGEEGSWGERGT